LRAGCFRAILSAMKTLLMLFLFAACAHAETGTKIVEAARKQVGVTVSYDPGYAALKYPGGDVPKERGVCTDVVIRAIRDALGQDLQKLVHEDMKANFAKYPKIWGLKGTDRNIDHRRVPNLMVFLKRKHTALPVPAADSADAFRSGDLVTCTVPPHLPHIMVVSDRKNAKGIPLVIHNIGGGTREEDRLGEFPLTGHFRWKD
jgi:uncharacterized protein YijF (DUF1287 family)